MAERQGAEAAEPAWTDDPPLDWRALGPEDWISLVIFWVLAATVGTQVFTRYVLNNSLAWTEEIARYLLILVTFVGAAIAVRRNSHIMIEFCYRYLSAPAARTLTRVVDLLVVPFYLYTAYLAFEVAVRTKATMTSLPWPKSLIYYLVAVGLLACAARALQTFLRHWRRHETIVADHHEPGRV
jgi:TRAP-type C4-dicarboxylate transport system permease small subunit